MNLRETRLDRRLTQPQIVAKMKEVEPRVDVALYSKMESGICLPTPPLMGVILSVLNCPLHDIYSGEEVTFPAARRPASPYTLASLTAAREIATARPGASACAWTMPPPNCCRRSAPHRAINPSRPGSRTASTP